MFQGGWSCSLPVLQVTCVCLCCLQAEHRTMTAFILAVIVNNYNTGQVSPSLSLHPLPPLCLMPLL